jgi:hypothetical protein
MVNLVETEIDGQVFKIQSGFSYVQQNEFMQILEKYIDLFKLKQLQGKETKNISMDDLRGVLKDDVGILTFNYELSKYLLLNIVKEPVITNAELADPDNPNSDNYYMLGVELAKLAMPFIGRMMNLKKTLSKSQVLNK